MTSRLVKCDEMGIFRLSLSPWYGTAFTSKWKMSLSKHENAVIINPYTGREIDIGVPYVFEDKSYYALNLVSKALTANDEIGVNFFNDGTGGIFFACATGDSTSESLGKSISFTYPEHFLANLVNYVFKTDDLEIQLLAASDGANPNVYVNLDDVRDYMTKGSYFTELSVEDSGIWVFKIIKPIVKILPILPPKGRDSFLVGDEITVSASIENVGSARSIVGNYFFGYTDGFEEHRYELQNLSRVTFNSFKLMEGIIGKESIKNGRLAIRVEVLARGTAITAPSTMYSADIQFEMDRVIFIPHTVNKILNGASEILEPVESWGVIGKGAYPQGIQKDANGCYLIAVGPKIIDPNYPDDGKIWADDFVDFSKRIDVVLEHKISGERKIIECIVHDCKAHTYNKYPDGHAYDTGDTASVEVENGLLQTGIAYPNSTNASKNLALAPDNMDGTVIEFCGWELDFNCDDYRLIELIVLNE